MIVSGISLGIPLEIHPGNFSRIDSQICFLENLSKILSGILSGISVTPLLFLQELHPRFLLRFLSEFFQAFLPGFLQRLLSAFLQGFLQGFLLKVFQGFCQDFFRGSFRASPCVEFVEKGVMQSCPPNPTTQR